MKKSLLTAFALALACYGTANAEITVTSELTSQFPNDTMLFAMPVNPEVSQEIWTTYTHPVSGQSFRPTKYQPEYLVTAQDFTRGDTNVGTANLPKHAKVIGLYLEGYYQNCERDEYCYQTVTAWCRNIPREDMTLRKLDLFDGFNTVPPEGQLCVDTTRNHGPQNAPGILCPIDVNSNMYNLCRIVDLKFGSAEDERTPFWYTGENIYLTLWLINRYLPSVDGGTHIEYQYMAYDDAEVDIASLMRSGNICFNTLTQDMVSYVPAFQGIDLMYELPAHRLPAFRTPYYTNDARITCEGYDTEFELRDMDGNVLTPDEVSVTEEGYDYFVYRALNHEGTYEIYTTMNGDKYRGSFNFHDDNDEADIYADVNVVIRNTTAVEEVGAAKAVSSVVYYNVAGQKSTQAMEGMNIVVTTYNDGTTTTTKVIK